MDGIAIRFYGEGGRCKEVRKEDFESFFGPQLWLKKEFFFEPQLSSKRMLCYFSLIKRLIGNKSFYPALLMLKGFANARIGKKPAVTDDEFAKICFGAIGFEPKELLCALNDAQMRYDVSGFPIMGIVMLYIALGQIVRNNQYCLQKEGVENKIVIDAGANIGVFSIYAANLGAKKVYAFEPVKETFHRLEQNIKLNKLQKIVIPINMALGECKGNAKISYSFSGDGEASIEFFEKGKKSQDVRVTTIDEFIKSKERVSFIKIDSEGYEAKVLFGARKTITKYKPILSFSAYHKPDDRERLPEVVKTIRSEYRCRLERRAEEVFYCE